jgi:alanyl-tRNA synthetase
MEFRKTAKGFEALPQKNVDFGGGLERIAAALNDDPDVFMIDLFDKSRSILETLSGKSYGKDANETRSFRIVMDHMRASTMLMADGALPSNRDQGYFTRRMLRRAIRFAGTIGINGDFCAEIGSTVLDTYASAYPVSQEHRSSILDALTAEERQFRRTLAKGEKELSEYLQEHDAIDGRKAFYFFETYGFPRELTEELLAEHGKHILDPASYEQAQKEHQEQSRLASTGKFSGGLADQSVETTKLHTATHLLNAALRKVLGEHVWQKGSNITAERLRFDFSHPEKMTKEQIKTVEDLVNEAIKADAPVSYQLMTVDEAKAAGAIGVFESKYGEKVKVYSMGKFSKEICGGPHVAKTGMLGQFKIQKEESSSAGVRRIKAVVSGGPKEIEVAEEAR